MASILAHGSICPICHEHVPTGPCAIIYRGRVVYGGPEHQIDKNPRKPINVAHLRCIGE